MCNMHTLYTRTSRRACFCPLGFAKFAAYRGRRLHLVALNTDRFFGIVPGIVPCPVSNLESRMREVEDRLPAAAEILLPS